MPYQKEQITLIYKYAKEGGDKFKAFANDLCSKFNKIRRMETKQKIPAHTLFERTLCIAYFEAKANRYLQGDKEELSRQVAALGQKYRSNIVQLSGETEEKVRVQENKMLSYLGNFPALFSSNWNFDNYWYNLILSICDKRTEKTLFGKFKSAVYAQSDFMKLNAALGMTINFMDYDDEKNKKALIREFEDPVENEVYILKAKDEYYLLYAENKKNLSAIVVTNSSRIPASEVEKIFNKSNKMIESSLSTSFHQIEPSVLYPSQVNCSNCNKSYPEFDCLFWNYSYFCAHCIIDINVDTTDIPAPRIMKYCQQRNLNISSYDVPCPECSGITTMRKYSPAAKPRKYKCSVCTKDICIEHRANIYDCFCFCFTCQKPTIYIQNQNINYCQYCIKRYCFNCRQLGNVFCKCICKYCLGEDSKTHLCQPSCHYCKNSLSKLMECQCGLYICHGCLYFQMEKIKQGQSLQCIINEYV